MFELSVKTLGELMLKDFCPRCFWFKYHYPLKEKHPHHMPFPRIFNDIDSYIKNVIRTAFNNPDLILWFKDFKETHNIVDIKKNMKYKTTLGSITISGIPDLIFILENDNVFIVDFKTAKFTETLEKLFPLYEAQLNGYAFLLERNGLKVKHLALIYLEPITSSKHPAFKLEFHEERPILLFDFIMIQVEKWDKEKVIELIR
jgi:CRISPR/Cas system-associated exonuclease Cas4 (RecB family)